MEDLLFSNLGTLESCKNKKGLLVLDSNIKSVASLKTFISKNKISLVLYKVEEGIHLEQMIRQRIPTMCYGAEFHSKKDHGHQANSGLDKPLVELMKQKGIVYGFCMSDLKDALNGTKSRKIIPRISQNLMLLKKYSCPYECFSGDFQISELEKNHLINSFTKK